MAASVSNMETDDLSDTMNDFLPLLPENIKQELFDTTEKGNLCDSVENKIDEAETANEPLAPSKCVWCQQTLTPNDHPKLLECLHIACHACVKQKITDLSHNSPLICPVCKMESRLEYIIDNVFLSETSSSSSEDNPGSVESTKDQIKCSSCSDDANATSWCVECAEFICDSCVQAHQRLKITKEHTIKPKEAACSEQTSSNGLAGKNIMCHMHSQEKLSLYCETCDRLTCRDCQLLDHRDHKYKFANEIASETRSSLSALLSEISYKKVLLSSAMKVIDDRQAQITEKKKELSKEIADLVVKLTNAVNTRGKQLVYRLNQVCDTKLQVLNEKKEALQLLSGHTDHCIEFVQSALDKGSDSAVLYSKKTLARHLQKVKSQRADIPNPEIPVRVQLYLSNVPELQSVIARIGTILVDGKVYPPAPGPNNGPPGPPGAGAGPIASQSRNKQPSPNITPPLRPGMPGPGMTTLSANGPGGSGPGGGGGGSGFSQVPPMYNGSSGVPVGAPFPPNHPMSRTFSQENGPGPGPGFGRFGQMGPPMGMPPQQHVSSSTHPQNMDISLRNLLNQKSNGPPLPPPGGAVSLSVGGGSMLNSPSSGSGGGSGGCGNAGGHSGNNAGNNALANNQFTGTANFMGSGVSPGASGGGPPSHRLSGQLGGPGNFLGGPGGAHQSFNQPPTGGQPNSGGMGMGGGGPAAAAAAVAAARFQSFPRFAMPPSMRHIMGNNSSTLLTPKQQSLRYPAQQNQPGYSPNSPQPPQLPPQLSGAPVQGSGGSGSGGGNGNNVGGNNGGAKWHIPQNMQAQQNNGFCGPSGLHLFGNGPNESFKIPLKSPDTMRNAMLLNGSGSSGGTLSLGGHGGGSGAGGGSSSSSIGSTMHHHHHHHHSQQQQQQQNQQQQHQQQQLQQQQQQQQQLHSQQQLQNHLQQLQNALPNVSSTNPKTPSPSTNEPGKDFAESIDKTCEDSVNDLMATIAKLDSNGVQVLPEGHRGKTTSPQVHSSTDVNTSGSTVVSGSSSVAGSTGGSNNNSTTIVLDDKNMPKDLDPNEDWCAVCMDGGELMCCDKCPKVFHQTCHIPVIDSLPDESETWQCLLCYNFADLPPEPTGEKRNVGITPLELKILQRIVLELFCQYETSMPFRQLEPETNKAYYDIVRNPISLTTIREKLEMSNNDHYTDIASFIADVKRLFDNVYLYYQEDSMTYKNARKLEKFFEQQLSKWLPKYLEVECYSDDYIHNASKRSKNHQGD